MTAQRQPDFTSPAHLHRYVDNYNWEAGYEHLMKVIKHEMCDRGTALMMFWRSGAAHLLSYTSRQDVPVVELDAYDLVKSIEARYVADDFAHRSILFNPRNDGGNDWTADYATSAERMRIPASMLENSMVTLGRRSSRKVVR